ncbi:MAG: cupin domain-containing protein [Rhodospirillales bacterium]|nr:cupin domain-containing protein [Rhodospirillales bacterium]
MIIWRNDNPPTFTPPGHFGGLKVSDIVPFAGKKFSVQVSKAPPGAGGEMHHHDSWEQVFYIIKGQLTFDTGKERFTLHEGQSVFFAPKDPHYTLNEGKQDSVSLVITVDVG